MSGAGFLGHIQVRPALNAVERGHLAELADSGRTLRGTPTGRGDREVPFARLAWEACPRGCCLYWNALLEASTMMLPSLQFLIDHLLGADARAEGRPHVVGFTFDHVLYGAVLGRAFGDAESRLVEVADNAVTEQMVDRPTCGV